jgi:AcrR family transcriptional regulator
MVDQKRKYELRKRADAMQDTRRRIAEAAMELHGSVGPARTTVSAVAERAGVQRHTVYRHFPTEDDLFAACSAHFAELHPRPDVAAWEAIEDPAERLGTALDQLYAWYEQTATMFNNIFRDEDLVEAIGPNLQRLRDYLDEAVLVLAAGLPRRKVVRAAIRHAIDLRTWQSLAGHGGLSRPEAVGLMTAMILG